MLFISQVFFYFFSFSFSRSIPDVSFGNFFGNFLATPSPKMIAPRGCGGGEWGEYPSVMLAHEKRKVRGSAGESSAVFGGMYCITTKHGWSCVALCPSGLYSRWLDLGGGGVRDGEKEGRGGGSFCPRCSPQELVAPGCFSFWPIDVDSSIHSIMLTASIFSRFYPPPSPSKKSCIPSISRLQLECALWGGEGRGGRKDGTGEGTGGDWVHLGGGC